MARFYGEVTGSAGTATRRGTKGSGIHSHTRGWNLGAEVQIFVNDDGNDELIIRITGGSNKPNRTRVVYKDEYGQKKYLNIDQEYRLALDTSQLVLDFNN
jgi:hypothetical protein